MKIYFRTPAFSSRKTIDLASFNFSCTSDHLSYSMNQDSKGDVSGLFTTFNKDINKPKLKEALKK